VSASPAQVLRAPDLGPESLTEAKALLGMPIRIEQWNHEASRDVIRHYAWGIGDDNPLWCDPAYAARTRWGGIIAPPTFYYGVFDAVVAPGLPDIQWIYSGADWTFRQPARRNDEVTARARYADVKEVGGKRVARMLVQTGDVEYVNQRGEVLARALSHTFRIARQSAQGGLKYAPRAMHRYSADDLAKIEAAVVDERRRGGDTLHYEDVNVGDRLPGTVRGPINRLDMTCYYAGAVGTSGYKSTRLKWLYANWARTAPDRLPNNYDPSYYSAAVSPSIGHQDEAIATAELGMPGAYDNGPQRIGFMAACVTNWMGDDAFMRAHSVRVKLPVIFGDTHFFKGEVAGKRVADGKGLVDVRIWAENQLGEVTATGTSTVELVRRAR
jgi:acyl dehydratase